MHKTYDSASRAQAHPCGALSVLAAVTAIGTIPDSMQARSAPLAASPYPAPVQCARLSFTRFLDSGAGFQGERIPLCGCWS